MNVLITRPLHQAQSLKSLLENDGHNGLLFPTLKIKKLIVDVEINNYDALIFISNNSVKYAIEQITFPQNRTFKVFAVGAATANKLKDCGIEVDCHPQENASSENLLSTPIVSQMENKKILIVRGKGGRETLKLGLSAKHNYVDYLEVYERTECEVSDVHIESIEKLLNNQNSVLTITSIESLLAMLNIVKKIDPNCLDKIKSMPLIVLSNRISYFAKSVGFLHTYVAYKTNNYGLVALINQLK